MWRRERVFHRQLPGGRLGVQGGPRHPAGTPPCLEQVSTPLGLGTSTSLTRWGDYKAGEVAPPDLSWGPMPAWTPAPEAEEHILNVGMEKIRRWWCRGEVGKPLRKGDAGVEGPCENAHHDSRKQSERRKEGSRPGHMLHGGGDHPLLDLQGVLVGVLALFGPTLGGKTTTLSSLPARPAFPEAPPGP